MEYEKWYALYSDMNHSKLLTTASTLEKLQAETEYYTEGVWFEYDQKPGTNTIFNERPMSGILFPKEAKKREYKEFGPAGKANFKWVS